MCENCKNKDICKYVDAFKKAETDVKIMVHPLVAVISINCKSFQSATLIKEFI